MLSGDRLQNPAVRSLSVGFSKRIQKTIYVPFGDTWVAGKRHIYTLIFGGGYNDQGEAVLNPIQFDAETTDWGNADKADKDVNV